MKIPLQSRKRGSINERLHLFAKMKKGTFFINWLLQRHDGKGYPFFINFAVTQNDWKGGKFQDITPIKATFTNTIANAINNSYPF